MTAKDDVLEFYKKYPYWYSRKKVDEKGLRAKEFEGFHPKLWVTTEENASRDFARFIEKYLTDVVDVNDCYHDIGFLTHQYEIFSTQVKEIVLPELKKERKDFGSLFDDCYYDANEICTNEYCNATREMLDFAIQSILYADKFIENYKTKSELDWYLLCSSSFQTDSAILEYLLSCLNVNNEYSDNMKIFMGLQQQNVRDINKLEELILSGHQLYAVKYVRNIKLTEYSKILKKILKAGNLDNRNKAAIQVTLCHFEYGEEGLINFGKKSKSYAVADEITDCYPLYRTKSFAEYLLKYHSDDPHVGYVLRHEKFEKFFEWFEKPKAFSYLKKIKL